LTLKPTRLNPFWGCAILLSLPLVFLIIFSLGKMLLMPDVSDLMATIKERVVLEALGRSIFTALGATVVAVAFGTPLAYILARRTFPGKKLVEGLVDLPIMIPHPVIGIAILSLFGRNSLWGEMLARINVEIMGSITGIIIVLVFVGAPFYINTVKAGFEAVPLRLEKASQSLGAGMTSTFFRVTFPMVWRNMILGSVMCTARAISEFGAVIVVAYHPMTAPVLIYERFTAFGLKYSQCVAFWLIIISLALFLMMRFFSRESPL
jgi:molybdate/tungstate transport system permease protein